VAPEREDKMGSVRDFVCENELPKDYLVEEYGEFYRSVVENIRPDIKLQQTFEQYYNEATKNKDEYCYKGVKNEV